jgi:hypothetical protein
MEQVGWERNEKTMCDEGQKGGGAGQTVGDGRPDERSPRDRGPPAGRPSPTVAASLLLGHGSP